MSKTKYFQLIDPFTCNTILQVICVLYSKYQQGSLYPIREFIFPALQNIASDKPQDLLLYFYKTTQLVVLICLHLQRQNLLDLSLL